MEEKMLKGKAKYLGWGSLDGATGPYVSITRCLLDGCRLIMWTNAGIWYLDNNDIKNAAENFGVGLRLVDIYEVGDEDIEAVFEPVPEAQPRFIYVNGRKRMTPANAYVLATDFAGEFGVAIYRENAQGERTWLWSGDYFDK